MCDLNGLIHTKDYARPKILVSEKYSTVEFFFFFFCYFPPKGIFGTFYFSTYQVINQYILKSDKLLAYNHVYLSLVSILAH